ncbi:hypothetical protein BaRGS_00018978 [Batillaria attramentaria]|uniref:Uncharacterized protein n=1 Tax=Batillaria attramentaria TaxID=370345 RepID=A0ABD0KRP8_9CAEN
MILKLSFRKEALQGSEEQKCTHPYKAPMFTPCRFAGCRRVTVGGWWVFRSKGYTEVADLLLQNHADVDALDKDGRSALHLACEEQHLDTARLLLNAQVNLAYENGATLLHLKPTQT